MSLILGSILNTGYICRFLLSRTPNFRHIGPQQLSPPNKNTSKSKFILCQIYPMISPVFPVVFPINFSHQDFVFRRRSGARLAVKILRGHEDLLQIFQRKFAPQADLRSTKREIKDPDVGVSGVGFFW
jgi:hypothetical protein